MIKQFDYQYGNLYRTASFYDYDGLFKMCDNNYLFCYSSCFKYNTVAIDCFNAEGQQTNHLQLEIEDCLIPSQWIHDEKKDRLIVSNKDCLNLNTLKMERSDQSFETIINDCMYRFAKDQYIVGPYLIKKPSEEKYECYRLDSGVFLWKQTLRGYLYHNIILKDDTFIICTAEHGGGVYLLDANTGIIKNVILTKGTRKICIVDNMLYTYVLGEKGKFISFDMNTGSITDQIELNRITIDCPLLVQNGEALTLSFLRVKRRECIKQKHIREYVPVISVIKL